MACSPIHALPAESVRAAAPLTPRDCAGVHVLVPCASRSIVPLAVVSSCAHRTDSACTCAWLCRLLHQCRHINVRYALQNPANSRQCLPSQCSRLSARLLTFIACLNAAGGGVLGGHGAGALGAAGRVRQPAVWPAAAGGSGAGRRQRRCRRRAREQLHGLRGCQVQTGTMCMACASGGTRPWGLAMPAGCQRQESGTKLHQLCQLPEAACDCESDRMVTASAWCMERTCDSPDGLPRYFSMVTIRSMAQAAAASLKAGSIGACR